ncbi:hypothetical protein M3Y99_01527000 [Aphelenchoides fujianensis]|nr:hypothetical protein M3Y99_01527000 [Aphelenchoides fujianensis]
MAFRDFGDFRDLDDFDVMFRVNNQRLGRRRRALDDDLDGFRFREPPPPTHYANALDTKVGDVVVPADFLPNETAATVCKESTRMVDGRYVYTAYARGRDFLVVDLLHRETLFLSPESREHLPPPNVRPRLALRMLDNRTALLIETYSTRFRKFDEFRLITVAKLLEFDVNRRVYRVLKEPIRMLRMSYEQRYIYEPHSRRFVVLHTQGGDTYGRIFKINPQARTECSWIRLEDTFNCQHDHVRYFQLLDDRVVYFTHTQGNAGIRFHELNSEQENHLCFPNFGLERESGSLAPPERALTLRKADGTMLTTRSFSSHSCYGMWHGSSLYEVTQLTWPVSQALLRFDAKSGNWTNASEPLILHSPTGILQMGVDAKGENFVVVSKGKPATAACLEGEMDRRFQPKTLVERAFRFAVDTRLLQQNWRRVPPFMRSFADLRK